MLRETVREKVFSHSLPELFGAFVSRLETNGVLVSEKDTLRLPSHSVDLSEEDTQLRARLEKVYLDAGVEAPTIEIAMASAQVIASQRVQARKIFQLLIDGRQIVRIQGDMFMHIQVVEKLKEQLLKYAAAHEPDRLIDVAAFKDLAGVSRKYAIPLLEYFDRERVTRRAGDKRLILKPPVS